MTGCGYFVKLYIKLFSESGSHQQMVSSKPSVGSVLYLNLFFSIQSIESLLYLLLSWTDYSLSLFSTWVRYILSFFPQRWAFYSVAYKLSRLDFISYYFKFSVGKMPNTVLKRRNAQREPNVAYIQMGNFYIFFVKVQIL